MRKALTAALSKKVTSYKSSGPGKRISDVHIMKTRSSQTQSPDSINETWPVLNDEQLRAPVYPWPLQCTT